MLILFSGRLIEPTDLPAEFHQQCSANAPVTDGFELPDLGIRMEELEVSLIEQALSKTAGNRSRAARLLGLSRDTLLYRMKKYAIA
jgi:transcriptional regulator with PAS, ATPase and Fis domain